jgi:hypothetical protein
MLFRQTLRRWLSSWLVLAVLFTQLATAAYACPMAVAAAGQGLGSAATSTATAAATSATPCAERMSGGGAALDPEQPGLCMQHCTDGSQTFDPANAPSVPAPALLPALTLRLPAAASLGLSAWAAQQRSRERDPPVPHSIDHCCYRI